MSHTYNQYGFPSSPFHIQLNTSNTNNIYSVDIIADPNVLGSTIDSPQLTPSGIPFYTAEITPNDYTQLLCAGNFKIDGISSSWVYNADYSNYSYHPNPCYPVNPPWYGTGADQHVKHSTPHPYILKGEGSNLCWGPNSTTGSNFIGNGTYRNNGPFVFDNSTYCDGDFLTSSEPIAWRKIVLVDIYQNTMNFLLNQQWSPSIQEDLEQWQTGISLDASSPYYVPLKPQFNNYPRNVRMFVFVEAHPTNPVTSNMSIDLDIDYIMPTGGCTDSSATNYDSVVEFNDGSCTYTGGSSGGCMDPLADNYDPLATFDNGTCSYSGGGIQGCTDPNANNYDPTATVDDGSCQYTPGPFSITISDGGGTGGPYTDEYANNTFSGTAPARNLVFNGDGSSITLANTYFQSNTYDPSTYVNESVQIEITPQIDQNGNIAVFDFPLAGGPNANITQTTGYNNQGTQWGDAKNNLTGCSVRVVNMNTPEVRPASTYTTSAFSDWHNSVDPSGYQPEVLTHFGTNPGTGNGTYTAHIVSQLADGSYFPATTHGSDPNSIYSGVGALEFTHNAGDSEVTANPALEFFPYKLWLVVNLRFPMPAENVDIQIQLDHDTTNQGDPSWTYTPIYGCTDPNAINYDSNATDDDGSCIAPIPGCTDPNATNYDSNANIDDGSCYYPSGGGKIICTTIYESTGLSDWEEKSKLWNRHLNKHLTKYHQIGYHALFYKFTLLMKKYKTMFKLGKYMTVQRSKDLEAVMGENKRHLPGMIIRYTFEPLCYLVGYIKSKLK